MEPRPLCHVRAGGTGRAPPLVGLWEQGYVPEASGQHGAQVKGGDSPSYRPAVCPEKSRAASGTLLGLGAAAHACAGTNPSVEMSQ